MCVDGASSSDRPLPGRMNSRTPSACRGQCPPVTAQSTQAIGSKQQLQLGACPAGTAGCPLRTDCSALHMLHSPLRMQSSWTRQGCFGACPQELKRRPLHDNAVPCTRTQAIQVTGSRVIGLDLVRMDQLQCIAQPHQRLQCTSAHTSSSVQMFGI